MRLSFRERDPFPLGLCFVVAAAVVVLSAFNINKLVNLGSDEYHAIVAEAAGISAGSPVTVSGVKVGRVTDVSLAGKGVDIAFVVTNEDVTLGDRTRANIGVATVLGDKELTLVSEGSDELADGATIPLSRTRAPYDVTTALSELTTTAEAIDTRRVARALDTVSATVEGAPAELRSALTGVERLARTLNQRDAQILDLGTNASQFSGILADRSDQLRRIVADGSLLLAELAERREAIRQLLGRLTPLAQQLTGLVEDNDDLGVTLDRVNRVVAVLQANKKNLTDTLENLSDYATGLGEAVGSGRFFTADIQNLVPGNFVPASSGGLGGVLDQLGLLRSTGQLPSAPRKDAR